MTSCQRLCPTVEGSSPLITHRIGVEVCLARQSTFFHKCHRCVYRGKPANWEAETPQLAMVNVHAAEEPVQIDVAKVAIPSQPAAATLTKPASPAKGGKAAQRSPGQPTKAAPPSKRGQAAAAPAKSAAANG
ncbi:MAG: hypothetical protein JNK49_06180 [Planctomycetes bacterium]|nr:hypothetical protein [Planctomycetota bacterium]